MKKTLKRLKQVNKAIAYQEERIANIPNIAYYEKFNQPSELKSDMNNSRIELRRLLGKKSLILDTLAKYVNLEKAKISEQERYLFLTLNKEEN